MQFLVLCHITKKAAHIHSIPKVAHKNAGVKKKWEEEMLYRNFSRQSDTATFTFTFTGFAISVLYRDETYARNGGRLEQEQNR